MSKLKAHFGGNTIGLIQVRLIEITFPFIIIALISYNQGLELYGRYALCIASVGFLNVFVEHGLSIFVLNKATDLETENLLNLFINQFIIRIVAFIFIMLNIFLIEPFYKIENLLLILINLFLMQLKTESFLIAQGQSKYIRLCSLLSKIIQLITLLLYWSILDLETTLISYTLSIIIFHSSLFIIFIRINKLKLASIKLNYLNIWKTFIECIVYLKIRLLSFGTTKLIILVSSLTLDDASLGIVSIFDRMYGTLSNLMSAITQSNLKRYKGIIKDKSHNVLVQNWNEIRNLTLIFTFVVTLLVFIFTKISTNQFLDLIPAEIEFMLLLLPLSAFGALGPGFLYAMDKQLVIEKIMLKTGLICPFVIYMGGLYYGITGVVLGFTLVQMYIALVIEGEIRKS